MSDPPKRGLNAMKRYFKEWWYTIIIAYIALAVGLFLFCIMWTVTFLGFDQLGTTVFWNGIIIYEAALVAIVFVFVFFASYRKRKVITLI
jgi:hypothetical protein